MYADLHSILLLMKRPNKTESPIFVRLCVLWLQRKPFCFLLAMFELAFRILSGIIGGCQFAVYFKRYIF